MKNKDLFVDVHIRKACELFKVKPEEVTPEMRRHAKELNFSLNYDSFSGGGLGHPKTIDELIEQELANE